LCTLALEAETVINELDITKQQHCGHIAATTIEKVDHEYNENNIRRKRMEINNRYKKQISRI
jgi:hypothetical protein